MEVTDLPLAYRNALAAGKGHFYKQFQPKEMDDVKVMFFHATAGEGMLSIALSGVLF
jgi:hypothetical protein